MIPKDVYDRLEQKPAFFLINKSGVGVFRNIKSEVSDQIAIMNIVMRSDKGQEFSMNYEPILVSNDIKSCIFGISSENEFEKVKRSNNNSIILLKTNSGEILTLEMYSEKEFARAYAYSSYKRKQQRLHQN